MKSKKVTYEKLREQLLGQLAFLEHSGQDEASCLEVCLTTCFDSLQRLREEVVRQPFQDKAIEILFFKSVKPVVLARYIYYGIRFQLYLDALTLDKEMLIDHYEHHLRLARKCLVDNKQLYHYYLAGDTMHDEAWFLRLPPQRPSYQDIHSITNPDFATNMDSKLAEILASRLLIEYIEKRLVFLRGPECIDNASIVSVLTCTASVSQVVEFVRALFLAGIFGSRRLEDVMDRFGKFLQVDLSNHAIITTQFRSRKINRTRFLDSLRDVLNEYFDELDKKGN